MGAGGRAEIQRPKEIKGRAGSGTEGTWAQRQQERDKSVCAFVLWLGAGGYRAPGACSWEGSLLPLRSSHAVKAWTVNP